MDDTGGLSGNISISSESSTSSEGKLLCRTPTVHSHLTQQLCLTALMRLVRVSELISVDAVSFLCVSHFPSILSACISEKRGSQ